MEYTLHPYQARAADKIVTWIRQEATGTDDVVITLTAPTGAGKTIISADAIERLLIGDANGPGDDQYTFLWLSLSPTLNEQTKDKFDFASAELAARSHIIDSSSEFVRASLEPGHIYFLNPHKLAPSSSQYRASNARDIDLWDTLAGTIKQAGRKLVVFVDEAHRGTGGTKSSDKTNATLMNQLLSGTGRGSTPVPIIVGISATPKRFDDTFPDRIRKPHMVDVNEVRESGLVKDKLLIAHPNEDIAADLTMLGVAAAHRAKMERLWGEHSEKTGDPAVHPILVLQIPANPTEVQLDSWVREILRSDPTLTVSSIAHSLQEKGTLEFGQYAVDYIDPTRIQDTTRIRVVLFKDALTTGWDCPRAEVLVSLRGTKDETVITQLIGRAVRTPLAKRVVGDEELNSVRVYLPHFDKDATYRVVGALNTGDDATASEVLVNPVRVEINDRVPEAAWEALAKHPTWTRPAKTARTAVDRLQRVAVEVMLPNELVPEPIATADSRVRSAIHEHYLANKVFIDDMLDRFAEVDFDVREFDVFSGTQTGLSQGSQTISTGNILDLYKQAKGRLPGHSADIAFKLFASLDEFSEDTSEARLAVAALAAHPETIPVIENAARGLLEAWRREHMSRLSDVNPQAAQTFAKIIAESTLSKEVPLELPEPGTVPWRPTQWEKHLIAAATDQEAGEGELVAAGMYPVSVSSSWESRVLDYEVQSPHTVGWYRNPTGGTSAIGIPWGPAGSQRVMYPDLIFFREEQGEITVSILDPHDPRGSDTVPKWRALGEYAAKNQGSLARVYAIIDKAGTSELHAVDLLQESVRTALLRAEQNGGSEAEVRKVFEECGFRYIG